MLKGDGKVQKEKERNTQVSEEMHCASFDSASSLPRFGEMGIQFGNPDRRRISLGDTKHPIVGEANGWYLNSPAVIPFGLLTPLLPPDIHVFVCALLSLEKQTKKNEKNSG